MKSLLCTDCNKWIIPDIINHETRLCRCDQVKYPYAHKTEINPLKEFSVEAYIRRQSTIDDLRAYTAEIGVPNPDMTYITTREVKRKPRAILGFIRYVLP